MSHCIQKYDVRVNFAKNILDIYYDYWLATSDIVVDEKNIVKDIYQILNYKVMEEGVVAVLLNYGAGLTIAKILNIYYDKNYQPVIAQVNIRWGNNNIETLWAIDYRLAKNETYRSEVLEQFSLTNSKNIFDCIFFYNNPLSRSSFCNLEKIYFNLSELDNAASLNRQLINIIYLAKSNKKLTADQLQNFGLQISQDGLGMLLTEVQKDGSVTTDVKKLIENNILTKDVSRWPLIENEFRFWLEQFFLFSGMATERSSTNRENILETGGRIYRVTKLEKNHFKARLKFIEQLNDYFKNYAQEKNWVDIVIEFDVLTDLQENLASDAFTKQEDYKNE